MIKVKIDKHQLNNNGTIFEIKDVDFEVKMNAFYALVGKSGSGKTSILNFIYGLGKIQEGSLKFNESLKHDDFEYITVDNNIFYALTVIENLNLYEHNEERINSILNRLQILNLKHKKCYELSKGEQQRIAIAKSILSSKKVILIDEPTANLNTELGEVVFQIFNEISKNKTIIVATHEKKYAQTYADKVIELENGRLVSDKDINPVKRVLDYDQPSNQNGFKNFLLILKLYFIKLFKKPITFIFSFVFILLTFLSIFVYDAITKIDEESSLINSFENLPYEYYKVHLGDLNGSLEESFLQIFQFRTLQSINTSVTFDSQDTFKITGKSIENYIIDTDLYPNTPDIEYYPIIVNEKLLDLIMNETGILISVGDVFPSGFSSTYPVEIRLIVVDTFTAETFEEDSNLLFPSVISKDVYLTYIKKTGIEDYTIGRSFADYTDKYNSYLASYPNKEPYTGVFKHSEKLKLVTSQMLSNEYMNMEEVEVTTGYYYYGQFPQEKNEVMISDVYLFNLLNENVTKDSVEQAYLDSNVFKVEDVLTYFNDNFGLEDIRIVGFFGYYDQSVQIHYGHMIISDLLFDEINESIVSNNLLTESDSSSVIFNKNQLLDNLDKIFDKSLTLGINHYDNFNFAYNNAIQFKNFLLVVIVFVFVISFVFMYIYIKNYQKETFSDDLRFIFMGKKKSEVISYHILVVSMFMIIPAIIVGILSNNILNAIMIMFTGSNQLLNLVITGISPVVSLLIPFGAFLLLIIIEVFLMTKNKMLEYIRYE